jgi:hypothetical protein
VDPTTSLEAVEKIKISYPCRKSNPDSSAVHPVTLSLYLLSYMKGNLVGFITIVLSSEMSI